MKTREIEFLFFANFNVMKTQILSDIHLEFGIREFDSSKCDLLLLAGDIHLGQKGIELI